MKQLAFAKEQNNPLEKDELRSPSFSVACDLNSKFDKGISKYQEVVVVEIDENSPNETL